MPNRLAVEAGRFVNILIAAVILLVVLSFALSAGRFFLPFVLAALIGGLLSAGVLIISRSGRGLGATQVGERAPEFAGKVGIINMAHIPVMGIGGLGIVAMSIVVGLVLPEGRKLLGWGLGGAIVGAASMLMWRHFHGGTPFTDDPGETLHLR